MIMKSDTAMACLAVRSIFRGANHSAIGTNSDRMRPAIARGDEAECPWDTALGTTSTVLAISAPLPPSQQSPDAHRHFPACSGYKLASHNRASFTAQSHGWLHTNCLGNSTQTKEEKEAGRALP